TFRACWPADRRWDEKRHLVEWSTAPPRVVEIRAGVSRRQNNEHSHEVRSRAKQLYCKRERCAASFVLRATQSRFTLSARVRNLHLSARRFDGAVASAALANRRYWRAAFARRSGRQQFPSRPPLRAG